MTPLSLDHFQEARAHQRVKYLSSSDARTKLKSLKDRGYHSFDNDSMRYKLVQCAPNSPLQLGVNHPYLTWSPGKPMSLGYFQAIDRAICSCSLPTGVVPDSFLLYTGCLQFIRYSGLEHPFYYWLKQQGTLFDDPGGYKRDLVPAYKMPEELYLNRLATGEVVFFHLSGPKTVNDKEKKPDGRRIELTL